MSRRVKSLLIAAAVAVAVFVGGPWVYINFVREPAAESFLDEITVTTLTTVDDTVGTTLDKLEHNADN